MTSDNTVGDESAATLYGRSQKLRVFISSEMRSGALRAERRVAAGVIDEHPAAEPWLWERNARAGRYSSLDVCIGVAKTSDVLLLILGDELTPVTEAEWRAAKAAGANCALIVKKSEGRTPRAQAFIGAERHDCIDVKFITLDDLATVVADALTQCITDAVRQRALARRWRDSGQGPAHPQLLEAGIERAEALYAHGSVYDASAVLAAVDLMLGGDHERTEDLELVTGLVQGATGNISTAMAAYERVINNPRSSKHAVAIAFQNLGIESMRAGHLERAADYTKKAYRRHCAMGNWFGVLQVVLNTGNLALEAGDTETASALAGMADDLRMSFAEALPRQQASIIGLRAHVSAQLGLHKEALAGYKSAYAIASRYGDVDGKIVSSQNVGAAYFDLGRPALARRWAMKALELAGNQGDIWRREEIHRLLAIVAYDSGKLDDARHHFEEGRALAAAMDDEWRVATLTADIGAVLVRLGSRDAQAELERARDLLTVLGDAPWLVRVGVNRAAIAFDADRVDDAIAILDGLLRIPGISRALQSEVHEFLAATHLQADRPIDATRHFRKALSLQQRTAESSINAALYAHRLQDVGEHRRALSLYDLSLRRAIASGDTVVVHDVQSDRALLLAAMGNEAEALIELEACLTAATRLRDADRVIRSLHNIGELARRSGDVRRSLKTLNRACSLAEKNGDSDAHRSALGLLSIAQLDASRCAEAKKTALDLFSKSEAVGDRANAAVALGVLGGAAFGEGEYRDAAEFYRRAARRNVSEPTHHAEDLCGLVESHAAADRWRPTVRAAQALVTHSQRHGLEDLAWRALSRAARSYLDRGDAHRAGILTIPAWILASQCTTSIAQKGRSKQTNVFLSSCLIEAMMTTACDECESNMKPCETLYREIGRGLQIDENCLGILTTIEQVRAAAAEIYLETA